MLILLLFLICIIFVLSHIFSPNLSVALRLLLSLTCSHVSQEADWLGLKVVIILIENFSCIHCIAINNLYSFIELSMLLLANYFTAQCRELEHFHYYLCRQPKAAEWRLLCLNIYYLTLMEH